MDWKVPLTDVTIGEAEVEAVADVLKSGWLTQGSRVKAFEDRFAAMLGVRHAVAVSNGTAALHLAYHAAGLNSGDEFITPCLTFIATISAGVHLGARPVLADCTSPDDLTLDPEDVARKITARTRLIVTMPYGGFCPDMEAIAALAREHGIALVEDACHAPLAHVKGRCMGTFGLAGTFSFFSNKNLATGEGGMVVTDDEETASRLARLRSHGMTRATWDRHQDRAGDYDIVEMGWNYRLDEMRAAIGLEQLDKLAESNAHRCRMAGRLRSALEALEIEGLDIPFSRPRGEPVHHIFVVLLPEGTDRRSFRARLAEHGVQTSMHYPLPHHFTAAAEILGKSAAHPIVPVAETAARRLVTLPMGPHLNDESVSIIARAVGDALRR